MGRKNRKKEDDEDFFASLAQPTKAPEPPVEEEDEEALYAKELAKAQAKEEKRLKAEAEKREKAAMAERARLAMEKRARKKKGADAEEEEEEEEAAPAAAEVEEAAPATAAAAAAASSEATAAASEMPALSPLGRILLFLRPYSSDVGALQNGVVAWFLTFFWGFFSTIADQETLDAVDGALRVTNPEAASKMDAEDDRKRTTMLFCPESGAWFDRDYSQRANKALRVTEDGALERWVKNLKTKSKEAGMWVKVKDGDGWASCPSKLTTRDDDLADSDVKFFAAFENRPFECTQWICSHLCTGAAARELEVVDGPKPLFSVEYDETNGLVATLQRKMLDLLNRKSGGEVDKNAKKAPKEKLSRADKKAKKQAYGR